MKFHTSKIDLIMALYINPINLQFDLLPTELAGRRELSKSQQRCVIITYYIPYNLCTAVGHAPTPFLDLSLLEFNHNMSSCHTHYP